MRRTTATMRLLVAAGLVASLGFSGYCRCPDTPQTAKSAVQADHDSTQCSCGSHSTRCCSGKPCKCESERPAAAAVKAAPDPAADLTQVGTLAINPIEIRSPALVPQRLDLLRACHNGFTTNLLAQGTRLNI